jgi:hypothetical protein
MLEKIKLSKIIISSAHSGSTENLVYARQPRYFPVDRYKIIQYQTNHVISYFHYSVRFLYEKKNQLLTNFTGKLPILILKLVNSVKMSRAGQAQLPTSLKKKKRKDHSR